MITALRKESGVGIIEVMISLALVMFAALAIARVQANAMISLRISDTHFGVNEQAQDMLEILRANKAIAQTGDYNYDYDSTIDVVSGSSQLLQIIATWKNQVGFQLPEGAGSIDCDVIKCQVSIRWKENVDGSYTEQYFNISGPI